MKNFFAMPIESIEQKCDVLMQVNASFLALGVTIITLLPIVSSAIASSDSTFFSKQDAMERISIVFRKLVWATYLFCAAGVIWFVGLFLPGVFVLLAMVLMMALGFFNTIIACGPFLRYLSKNS